MSEKDAATELSLSEQNLLRTVSIWDMTELRPLGDAWREWSGFAQLVPGEVSRGPPAFIPTHDMPHREWFAHIYPETERVHALGIHFVRDAIITGQGYVFSDGQLVTQDVYLHRVAVDELKAKPELVPAYRQHRICRTIEQPVLEILGPGAAVYGHWLCDFLPRAAIARETLDEVFHRFVIPLPDNLPDWILKLLFKFVGFRPENAMRYNPNTEFLSCPMLVSPTFGHGSQGYFFHSFVREFYARFQQRGSEPRTRRICLSRRNFEQETRGVLKNFAQRRYMEQGAQQRGFEIICPEELTFDEQVALFSNAGLVLGEFGSGLHNTLFSAPRTIIGSVGVASPFAQNCTLSSAPTT